MSLLDVLTGGNSDKANSDLEAALAAIQGVQTPTIQDLQFKIQQMVAAGQLTPQQAQVYLQNPSAFTSENIDQTGTQAQETSIADLLSAAQQGGLNPEDQAKEQQIVSGLNTQERGANDAILQAAAARGTLTGGETLAAQLQGNQNADVNANALASANAGNAYQQMLNEITSAGSAGAGLQGQQNEQANTVAAATDAINKFNAAQEQATGNYNTQTANEAQAANLQNAQNISNTNVTNANSHAEQQSQLAQQVYQDALSKAEAEGGIYGQQAQQATGQGNQLLNLEGGVVNAISPAIGKAFSGAGSSGTGSSFADLQGQGVASTPPAGYDMTSLPVPTGSDGGIVEYLAKGGGVVPNDGKTNVPGNSPKNDRIPAVLSPGEVVLPKTVVQPAMQGQSDKVMDFLNRIRQSKQSAPPPSHPHDVKSVLDALALRRVHA